MKRKDLANVVLQLAIATLATTFSIAAFSLSGGEKVDKTQPPINAKSKEEESFVKYVFPALRAAPHHIISNCAAHHTSPRNNGY